MQELEAEAVVDHGETTGTEREAPPIFPRDIFTGSGVSKGVVRLGGELSAQGFDVAAAQRVDQVAAVEHATALPSGKAFFDQALGAALHRVAHFNSEARFS